MPNKIYTCLWFNDNAAEAARFYCTLFKNSKLLSENQFMTNISLDDTKIMCINGGSKYQHSPANSQFITSENDEEIDMLWKNLSEGGSVLMPLDRYDWSEKYGFCQDKYGVVWQIFKGNYSEVNQKIVPCLLFVDESFGKAEAAIQYYLSIFKNSKNEGILKYENVSEALNGTVMHAQFRLNNAVFMAMDGAGEHHFKFTPANSYVIECDTQEEIDYYWEKLGHNGLEYQCGWLDDQFGVTWQIFPKILNELMLDHEKAPRVVEAFLKMKKFDIQSLLNA